MIGCLLLLEDEMDWRCVFSLSVRDSWNIIPNIDRVDHRNISIKLM